MTLDIIKPKAPILDTDNQMVQAGIDALAAGMVSGTVMNVHTAVECVNLALDKHFNGGVIRPYFKALLNQLQSLDTEADTLARDGCTVQEIASALSDQTGNFTLANLQQMKIEVYGSVDAWLTAMTGEA